MNMIKLKMKVLAYYSSDKCQCGKTKKSGRWECIDCRQIGGTLKQHEVLVQSCNNHVKQGIKYLNQLKRKRNERIEG